MAAQIRPTQIVSDHACFQVLGVRIDCLADLGCGRSDGGMDSRSRADATRSPATGMHGTVEAQHDPSFKEALDSTDLVVPDGMPLVWLGRRRGHHLPRRVYGPDLMLEFCEKNRWTRLPAFFFMAASRDVPERFGGFAQAPVSQQWKFAETFSPPFRSLGPEEDQENCDHDFPRRSRCAVGWFGDARSKNDGCTNTGTNCMFRCW